MQNWHWQYQTFFSDGNRQDIIRRQHSMAFKGIWSFGLSFPKGCTSLKLTAKEYQEGSRPLSHGRWLLRQSVCSDLSRTASFATLLCCLLDPSRKKHGHLSRHCHWHHSSTQLLCSENEAMAKDFFLTYVTNNNFKNDLSKHHHLIPQQMLLFTSYSNMCIWTASI